MLRLLGFYDELDTRPGQPNGSLREAVRAAGEPDEVAVVAYLDAGHVLLDVMESGRDAITGRAHRHSSGCSSVVTDGVWFWRLDLPHYVEAHHVVLPEAFIERVRLLDYRMPALITTEFAPRYDEAMSAIGWASALPWKVTAAMIEPESREVPSKARFEAQESARRRDRPRGSWAKPRKPRRS